MTGLLAAALDFARRGLPVFPAWPLLPHGDRLVCACGKTLRCENPGKHPMGPLVRHGVTDASTESLMVEHWWRSRPDANIGLATGRLVVLDIDPRHGGDHTLAELEQQHGKLPHTWRVRTGGGGAHVYFAAPATETIRNSTGQIGQGIDVRGAGGYVIAPPSRHETGRQYLWQQDPDHAPLSALPAWLSALIEQRSVKRTPSIIWRSLVCDSVTEGQRNDTVAKLAGHLLRRYVDPHVVLELVQAWNQARCTPPLDSNEVTRTVDSIARRELKRREFDG
jgi:hypothetical protein